jgi:hypothetical protein
MIRLSMRGLSLIGIAALAGALAALLVCRAAGVFEPNGDSGGDLPTAIEALGSTE